MGSEAETVFIEFLDAQRALVSGPWHGGQDETIALNLLGGLRTSLHHPSCLRIYDVGRAGPRWWATFEAVRGMDVLDWRAAQGRRISPRGAARIVADLAAILADVDTEWSH